MVAVTIRNIPDDVCDELAARAARSGRSLQEYLAQLLVELAGRPSVEDVLARARGRPRTTGSSVSIDDILAPRRRPSVSLLVLDASAWSRCSPVHPALGRPWLVGSKEAH